MTIYPLSSSSPQEAFERPTVKPKPDFTINDGVARGERGRVQSAVMSLIYPAQSSSYKEANNLQMQEVRRLLPYAIEEDTVIQEVTLERNGVRYDGLIVGKKSNLANGNWVLQATGNMAPIEYCCLDAARIYGEAGFNTLLINGPGVGRSEGVALPKSMGEAQETGLRFLETAIKANHIAIAGHSLGGAAIGQAILQHKFDKKINYLVIRQFTFDRLSNAAAKIGTQLAKCLLPSSLEMDNVEASKKLQELGIKEVIIQATDKEIDPEQTPALEDFKTDGVIPARAGLGYRLVKEGITTNKVFHCIKNAHHNNAEEYYHATSGEIMKHFAIVPSVDLDFSPRGQGGFREWVGTWWRQLGFA